MLTMNTHNTSSFLRHRYMIDMTRSWTELCSASIYLLVSKQVWLHPLRDLIGHNIWSRAELYSCETCQRDIHTIIITPIMLIVMILWVNIYLITYMYMYNLYSLIISSLFSYTHIFIYIYISPCFCNGYVCALHVAYLYIIYIQLNHKQTNTP